MLHTRVSTGHITTGKLIN